MDILLYNNISDRRTLTKSISLIRELTGCELYCGSSLSNPIFKLKYYPEYIDCNYIYIPEFKRYYFCRPDVDPGGIIYFYCECDVLMSANEYIKNLDVRVCRYEQKVNPFVPDNNMTKNSRTETTNLYFNGGVSPFTISESPIISDSVFHWVLSVVGGDGGAST